MKYDFDTIINRKETFSLKWDSINEGVIPLWVADMDFKSPQPVIEAVEKRAEHGVFGYSYNDFDGYYDSVINWMKRRHDLLVKKEWIIFSPGVMPAISACVQAFTDPEDKIIIQQPVYYPFINAIKNNGRKIVNNKLQNIDGKYNIDFKDLENKAIDTDVKMMILCNPHNPVGRVWKRHELERIAEICYKNNIILIADEIHQDIIFKPHKHISILSIDEKYEKNTIICTSPSKTFNLAGLQLSNIIIPNNMLKRKFKYLMINRNFLGLPNPFAVVAAQAAYNYGEEWLEELIKYLQSNVDYTYDFCLKNFNNKITLSKPEGTYLLWLDFRRLGFSDEDLKKILLNKAKVQLSSGEVFGEEGKGFQRINIACSRMVLKEGMQRIQKNFKKYDVL